MELEYTTHAQRQLKKLPKAQQGTIRDACRKLQETWPRADNAIRLKDRKDYRLRIGRYRVIFEIDGDIVVITQVLIRSEDTYQ